MNELKPFHFPVSFAEVFLRDRAGFDVILGNPPWEEATLEEDRFWNRYVPGLQGLSQHEQETIKSRYRRTRPDLVKEYQRELADAEAQRCYLVHGPFPGMGTGDPDLYRAFCWRFHDLANAVSGRVGVALPRSAFSAKGSATFRKAILAVGCIEDLVYLINSAGWVFDDAEWRYTIALASVSKASGKRNRFVRLRGPFTNLDRFRAGMAKKPVEFRIADVLTWTDTAALPLLPGEQSAEVFAQIRKAPRLSK
jgi:hypothetical protein